MTTTHDPSWSTVDYTSLPSQDALLSCLILLTRYYQHPLTEKMLTARLPLTNHLLTTALFQRAAERAKLSSHIKKQSLKELNLSNGPIILLLKDNKAALYVLDNNETYVIIPTENTKRKTLQDIEKEYLGYVIFVEKTFTPSDRS